MTLSATRRLLDESANGALLATNEVNLMEGAARVTRAGQLRSMGLPVTPELFSFRPVAFE